MLCDSASGGIRTCVALSALEHIAEEVRLRVEDVAAFLDSRAVPTEDSERPDGYFDDSVSESLQLLSVLMLIADVVDRERSHRHSPSLKSVCSDKESLLEAEIVLQRVLDVAAFMDKIRFLQASSSSSSDVEKLRRIDQENVAAAILLIQEHVEFIVSFCGTHPCTCKGKNTKNRRRVKNKGNDSSSKSPRRRRRKGLPKKYESTVRQTTNKAEDLPPLHGVSLYAATPPVVRSVKHSGPALFTSGRGLTNNKGFYKSKFYKDAQDHFIIAVHEDLHVGALPLLQKSRKTQFAVF